MKFSMTCSCGDVVPMEAANREEAVAKYKAMMTEEMAAKHFADKHPGQAVPPIDQIHAMIEKEVQAVA